MHLRDNTTPCLAARAVRILAFIPLLAGFVSVVSAGTLENEAAVLRSKCLSNAAAISSLDLTSTAALDRLTGAGKSLGDPRSTRDAVKWSRGKAKLKWSRPGGDPTAYVADVTARTLTTAMASGTTYTEILPADKAEALGTPFPGWLWQPAGLIPGNPARVREEAGALVLVSSASSPSREVWLDRATGCLLRFTETGPTGRVVRTVVITGWAKRGGVWLPGTVEDIIQGTDSGLRRVVRFESAVPNPPLADSDFRLP